MDRLDLFSIAEQEMVYRAVDSLDVDRSAIFALSVVQAQVLCLVKIALDTIDVGTDPV